MSRTLLPVSLRNLCGQDSLHGNAVHRGGPPCRRNCRSGFPRRCPCGRHVNPFHTLRGRGGGAGTSPGPTWALDLKGQRRETREPGLRPAPLPGGDREGAQVRDAHRLPGSPKACAAWAPGTSLVAAGPPLSAWRPGLTWPRSQCLLSPLHTSLRSLTAVLAVPEATPRVTCMALTALSCGAAVGHFSGIPISVNNGPDDNEKAEAGR